MKIFDYIYYRIYEFYVGFYESAPWVFGIGALIVSEYSLLIVIDRINFLMNPEEFYMKGRSGDVILCTLVIFNLARYLKFTPYMKLKEQWENENVRKKRLRGALVLFYLFGSILSMLYLTGFFN